MDNSSKDLELQLNDLKQQISLLKRKLDSERIITKDVIENATKSTLTGLRNMAIMRSLACIIFIPILIYDMYFFLNLPLALCIVTVAFMLWAAVFQILNSWHLFGSHMMSKSVVERTYTMIRHKKRSIRGLYAGITFLVLWFPWFFYAIMTQPQFQGQHIPLIVGCVVGGVIGGFFGIRMFLKEMRLINDSINNLSTIEDPNNHPI